MDGEHSGQVADLDRQELALIERLRDEYPAWAFRGMWVPQTAGKHWDNWMIPPPPDRYKVIAQRDDQTVVAYNEDELTAGIKAAEEVLNGKGNSDAG